MPLTWWKSPRPAHRCCPHGFERTAVPSVRIHSIPRRHRLPWQAWQRALHRQSFHLISRFVPSLATAKMERDRLTHRLAHRQTHRTPCPRLGACDHRGHHRGHIDLDVRWPEADSRISRHRFARLAGREDRGVASGPCPIGGPASEPPLGATALRTRGRGRRHRRAITEPRPSVQYECYGEDARGLWHRIAAEVKRKSRSDGYRHDQLDESCVMA